VGIDKMVLLGHSFGGYLSSAYALRYPDSIVHLIAVDPWGFLPFSDPEERLSSFPWYFRAAFKVLKCGNPLFLLRFLGPIGRRAIRYLRSDLIENFSESFEIPDSSIFVDYFYNCNTQAPTGESIFWALMENIGWAKSPIFPRLTNLDEKVPLTVLYGEYSWLKFLSQVISQEDFAEIRPKSYTKTHVISNAAHHVYLDNLQEFTRSVEEACKHSKV